MSIEQLTEKAFHYMWSALHFPSETNHAGKKIIDLLKYNAMSSFSKSLFDDFEKNKNFSQAATILIEMENLFIGNSNLQNQVNDVINTSKNDSMIPMPPIQRETAYQPSYANNQDSSDNGGRIIGALFFFGGIILTAMSDGQAIFYGAIIYGFIKMITG
jgi:hypothetical protein